MNCVCFTRRCTREHASLFAQLQAAMRAKRSALDAWEAACVEQERMEERMEEMYSAMDEAEVSGRHSAPM